MKAIRPGHRCNWWNFSNNRRVCRRPRRLPPFVRWSPTPCSRRRKQVPEFGESRRAVRGLKGRCRGIAPGSTWWKIRQPASSMSYTEHAVALFYPAIALQFLPCRPPTSIPMPRLRSRRFWNEVVKSGCAGPFLECPPVGLRGNTSGCNLSIRLLRQKSLLLGRPEVIGKKPLSWNCPIPRCAFPTGFMPLPARSETF